MAVSLPSEPSGRNLPEPAYDDRENHGPIEVAVGRQIGSAEAHKRECYEDDCDPSPFIRPLTHVRRLPSRETAFERSRTRRR